jgi:dihydroorotase
MCDAPALVWDLLGKGRIAVGYDADLVLVDLDLRQQVLDERQQTKCGWSPWHGQWLNGWPIRTWVRGQCVFQEGVIDESCRGSEAKFDHARGGYWAATAMSE